VKMGKIRYACEEGSNTLRARMLAALLVAKDINHHPLKKMLAEYPDLFHKLNYVADIRDTKAAHDSTGEALTKEDNEKVRNIVFETIKLYLDVHR